MAELGSVSVSFKISTKEFTAGLQRINKGLESTQTQIKSIQADFTKLATNLASVAHALEGIGKLENLNTQFADLQNQMHGFTQTVSGTAKTVKQDIGGIVTSLNSLTKVPQLQGLQTKIGATQTKAAQPPAATSITGKAGLENLARQLVAIAAVRKAEQTVSTLINNFAELETAAARVSRVLGDTTQKGVATLTQEFQNLSTKIPANATEIANVAEGIARLGDVSKADIIPLTEVSITLAQIAGVDAGSIAEQLASLALLSGVPTAQIGNLASAIIEVADASIGGEQAILKLADKFAGAAHTAGFTAAGIIALAGVLKDAQIGAELGGTAITQFITKMDTAVKSGTSQLSAFASIAGKTKEEFKSIVSADAFAGFTLLIRGMQKAAERGEALGPILEILGVEGGRQTVVFNALVQAVDKLSDKYQLSNRAIQSTSALQKAGNFIFKQTEAQLKILQNQIDNTTSSLIEGFTAAFKDTLTVLSGGAGVLQSLAEGFKNMDPAAQQVAGLVIEITSLIVALRALYTVFLLVERTALGAFVIQAVAAGAVIAVVAAGVVDAMQKIKNPKLMEQEPPNKLLQNLRELRFQIDETQKQLDSLNQSVKDGTTTYDQAEGSINSYNIRLKELLGTLNLYRQEYQKSVLGNAPKVPPPTELPGESRPEHIVVNKATEAYNKLSEAQKKTHDERMKQIDTELKAELDKIDAIKLTPGSRLDKDMLREHARADAQQKRDALTPNIEKEVGQITAYKAEVEKLNQEFQKFQETVLATPGLTPSEQQIKIDEEIIKKVAEMADAQVRFGVSAEDAEKIVFLGSNKIIIGTDAIAARWDIVTQNIEQAKKEFELLQQVDVNADRIDFLNKQIDLLKQKLSEAFKQGRTQDVGPINEAIAAYQAEINNIGRTNKLFGEQKTIAENLLQSYISINRQRQMFGETDDLLKQEIKALDEFLVKNSQLEIPIPEDSTQVLGAWKRFFDAMAKLRGRSLEKVQGEDALKQTEIELSTINSIIEDIAKQREDLRKTIGHIDIAKSDSPLAGIAAQQQVFEIAQNFTDIEDKTALIRMHMQEGTQWFDKFNADAQKAPGLMGRVLQVINAVSDKLKKAKLEDQMTAANEAFNRGDINQLERLQFIGRAQQDLNQFGFESLFVSIQDAGVQAFSDIGTAITDSIIDAKNFEKAMTDVARTIMRTIANLLAQEGFKNLFNIVTKAIGAGFTTSVVPGGTAGGDSSQFATGGSASSSIYDINLASGGITTGATQATIGEGSMREAVLPLTQGVFRDIGKNIAPYSGGKITYNTYNYFNNAQASAIKMPNNMFHTMKHSLQGNDVSAPQDMHLTIINVPDMNQAKKYQQNKDTIINVVAENTINRGKIYRTQRRLRS